MSTTYPSALLDQSWPSLLDSFEAQLDAIAAALELADIDAITQALDEVDDVIEVADVSLPEPLTALSADSESRARQLLDRQAALVRRLHALQDGIRLELAQLHGQAARQRTTTAPSLASFVDVAG